jgi:hypothetical protein
MTFIVHPEKGPSVEVPLDIEAQGPAAVAAYVASQGKGDTPPAKLATPAEEK